MPNPKCPGISIPVGPDALLSACFPDPANFPFLFLFFHLLFLPILYACVSTHISLSLSLTHAQQSPNPSYLHFLYLPQSFCYISLLKYYNHTFNCTKLILITPDNINSCILIISIQKYYQVILLNSDNIIRDKKIL